MNGFKFVFFIGVELPSMIAMAAHKMFCAIKGVPCSPLPVGVYRLIGVSGAVAAFFVFAIIFGLATSIR